jgi:transposase
MDTTSAKQPHTWREGRRLRAWELHQQGWGLRQIARVLGVTPGAVSQWLTRAHAAGPAALRDQPPPGRPARLTAAQRAQLPALLAQGAPAFGFRGDIWTAARVARVIQEQFGVQYHPAHVSRLLHRINWTPQKPLVRASQRDEAAIDAWYRERWPAIKKKPSGSDAPSSG